MYLSLRDCMVAGGEFDTPAAGLKQLGVEAIEQEVAPFVSEDDIARAYFQGEVWRLESPSS